MAHSHGQPHQNPERRHPAEGHDPIAPVVWEWTRIPLGGVDGPGRPPRPPAIAPAREAARAQHLRERSSERDRTLARDVDRALVAIGATFAAIVAMGLCGKALALLLFWLL